MTAHPGLPSPPPPGAGIVGALRRAGDQLIATVQDRLTLVSLELQEEKARLLRAHLWLSLALGAGLLALAFGSLTLVYLMWDYAPLATLLGLTALYTAVCVGLIAGLRSQLAREPRPFASSLDELTKDRTCLHSEHP